MRQGIGHAYIGLGRVLENQEHRAEAQAVYKKAEKMGVKVQEQPRQSSDPMHNAQQADDGSAHSAADASIIKPSPSGTQEKRKQGSNIPTVPPHIFSENMRPTTVAEKLPEPDERL
ncbi:hypothetical protein BGX31_004756, partial [Mortierella sp. GBA43]